MGVGLNASAGKKTKKATERVPSIDIRELKKYGYLNSNLNGTFTWSIGETRLGTVEFHIREDMLVLQYNQVSEDRVHKPTKQIIKFETTGCNYGGSRKWFQCGHCGRRVAVLYYVTPGFYCRHCHSLTYASQQENEEYRMMRKTRKIRERLGDSNNLSWPIWKKPKGMHQTTFDWLSAELEQASTRSWATSKERHYS